jgi:hypothetical protein
MVASASVVGALFCDPPRFTTFEPPEAANRGLNAELLCVLGVQSLSAAELHGLGTDDASNRRVAPLSTAVS